MPERVRGAVLEAVGEPVVIAELELIEPRAGEVRVRMLASGVCHSDLHVRDGEWDRPTPDRDGPRGRGRRRGGRAGRDDAACRRARGAVVAHPVRGVPVVPARATSGPAPTPRRTGTRCSTATAPFQPCRYRRSGPTARSRRWPRPSWSRPRPRSRCPTARTRRRGPHRLLRHDRRRGRAQDRGRAGRVPSVAVIGLGGVGLSCVMGAVVAGASRIVAIDRVAAKLDAARAVGATDTILAGDDAAATIEALRDLTDGGPDFVFEAIGRTDTAELAIAALPLGGTAVLVGMTPLGARAAFEVYPVRRRLAPHPRLELRLRRARHRLPALRGVDPGRPPAGRAADRPPDRARRHRGRLRRDAPRRVHPPGHRVRLAA